MITGTRYVVSVGNDTFSAGDHIQKQEDGSILCPEAQGWIEAEDAEESLEGVEFEVDQEWARKRIAEAEKEIGRLRCLLR